MKAYRCGAKILLTALLGMAGLAGSAAPGWASGALTDARTGTERAAWLLERGGLETALVAGEPLRQSQIGGSELASEPKEDGGGGSAVVPILMSAVLPGSGEAYLGYTRGWFMIALDLAAWYGVYHYNNQGDEKKDEYLAYADAHWSEEKFRDAYRSPSNDEYLDSIGRDYYGDQIDPDTGLPPLWVSKEDDFREYYENLGKWDQFVFGWDDFRRPDDLPPGVVYDPTGGVVDLQQPWISSNRETYRQMRIDSNDAYDKADRLLYVNIGLRVFSVLQVAYLQGLLGGGPKNDLRVAGHKVEIIAEPRGFTSSRLGASVSF